MFGLPSTRWHHVFLRLFVLYELHRRVDVGDQENALPVHGARYRNAAGAFSLCDVGGCADVVCKRLRDVLQVHAQEVDDLSIFLLLCVPVPTSVRTSQSPSTATGIVGSIGCGNDVPSLLSFKTVFTKLLSEEPSADKARTWNSKR